MIDTWWQWISAIVIQSSILILGLAIVDRLIGHRIWPQIRLLLWTLVLLKLVLPPGLSSPVSLRSQLDRIQENVFRREHTVLQPAEEYLAFQWPAIEERQSEPPLRTEAALGNTKPVTANPDTAADSIAISGSTSIPISAISWRPILFAVWMLGAIATVSISIWRFRKVSRRLLRSCEKVTDEIKQEIGEAAKLVGLSRVPAPILSNSLTSPAVFGIFRPIIVLPRTFTALNATDRRNVLVHELLHIRRKDLLGQRIVLGLQIIYWFNPLLILVRKKIQHLQELCCDAAAARKLEKETEGYRETLVRVSRKWITDQSFNVGQMALLEDRSRILQRLIWLERSWWKYRRTGLLLSSVSAVLFLAAILPMAAESQPKVGGFTVITARTFQAVGSGNANTYLVEMTVFFQSEDGSSRQFSIVYRDGKTHLRPPSPVQTRGDLCKAIPDDPEFIGESEVGGYRTLVRGFGRTRYYSEEYFAPDLGCWMVQSFNVHNTGVYQTRLLAVLEGIAANDAFRDNPVPLGLFTGEPEQLETLSQAYPGVISLIAEYEKQFSDLPSFETYLLTQQEQRETVAGGVSELAGAMEPFEYPFGIPLALGGRIGPDGSVYLSSRGTSEIHRCDPNGEVLDNYYLGSQENFFDAETFVIDTQGRLHVVLGYAMNGKFEGWKLRRFESPEIYDEFWLDERVLRPQDLHVDSLGNYYFLDGDGWPIRNPSLPPRFFVKWYSPVGTQLAQFQVDISFLPKNLTEISIPLKWNMAVPGPGRVVLLLNYWARSEARFTQRARLYSLDFNRHTITDVTPALPDDRSLLTALHQYGDEIVLEWSEYLEEKTLLPNFRAIPPRLFAGRKLLTRYGETSNLPLLQFDGNLIAYSSSFVIVEDRRQREGPIYFRIPIQ